MVTAIYACSTAIRVRSHKLCQRSIVSFFRPHDICIPTRYRRFMSCIASTEMLHPIYSGELFEQFPMLPCCIIFPRLYITFSTRAGSCGLLPSTTTFWPAFICIIPSAEICPQQHCLSTYCSIPTLRGYVQVPIPFGPRCRESAVDHFPPRIVFSTHLGRSDIKLIWLWEANCQIHVLIRGTLQHARNVLPIRQYRRRIQVVRGFLPHKLFLLTASPRLMTIHTRRL